ncbi:Lectin subunit alpha [Lucilia cuprina]|nr:Lectin subunit alpha [Lucilia cuprina]
MNMTLVEIKTEAKSLELYSLIEKAQEQNNIKGDFIWIGGILNRFPTHRFVWLSTGEYFTYTNWYDNNPDFYNDNEFCVELVMDENWRWNDDSCITRSGFICEYKEDTKKEDHETHKYQQVQKKLQEVDMQKLAIEKELQQQKDLQQKQLQQSQEHVDNLIKENENLQNKIKKLEENLEIEIKKQQNESILQKIKSPFENSQLENHIREALRPSNELKDNSNQLIKNEIPINGNIYTSDANKTYFIDFESKYSWFEGQIYCTQMNMTLVEIKTEAKSLELYSLIKKAQEQKSIKGDYIWIGGILNRFPTHQFVWLSTGEYFTYTNWYDNNPDFQDDNEFCVELVMDPFLENWKWNDDSCITTGGFICECKEGTKKEETQNKF